MARRRNNKPPLIPDPLTFIPPPVAQTKAEFTQNDAERLMAMMKEKLRRQSEAVKIFRPLPKTEPFHAGREQVRVILGGNRASKTTSWACEVARACTGNDPYNKFPKTDGVAFLFGPNEKHLGNVIHKKLFRAGLFDMIRDAVTGRWRAYDPIHDVDRKHLKKPAPPLIPPRYVKWISWAKKKENIPRVVTLRNGWEIHFYSTIAELPRGQAIDLAGIDEEVDNEGVISELRARCVDRAGRIIWGATPQQGTDQLFDLCEQDGNGDVKVYKTHIEDNPFISQDEKDRLFRNMSEDERRVRWDGQFMLSGFTIYPEFNTAIHCADPQAMGVHWEHFQPPKEWATIMGVDPGRQVCAVLFAAIPPPYIGKFIVIYDELHIEKCDADTFGKRAAEKSRGRVHDYALIDVHAAAMHDIGSGRNVQIQYQQAFKRHGGQLREPTQGFTWGCDDVQAGLEAVRDWLRISGNGRPFLHVYQPKCPYLCNEMKKYRYAPKPGDKRVPSNVPAKRNDHAVDILRYVALSGIQWQKPKSPDKFVESPIYAAFLKKQESARMRQGASGLDRGIRLGI